MRILEDLKVICKTLIMVTTHIARYLLCIVVAIAFTQLIIQIIS